jgi:hypothetical protein
MDGDAAVLLNLLDDLEYRVYSSMGPAILRRLPKGGFVYAKIVPVHPAVHGAWLISGMMRTFRKSDGPRVASVALSLAAERPELVFRNPERITQGWEMMRTQRATFDTVDSVYRKVLRKPSFTWADHGETLLHRRKQWYYEREPCPSISVIGNRLAELAARG